MARITFRSTTVADASAIKALLREAHATSAAHPMFETRNLFWKYWQPREDWPGSRSYVLTRDGAIIAHAAVVPGACRSAAGRISVLHVIDWAARAEARGAGNSLMRHIGTLGDAIVTSDGDQAALRLLPLMGFSPSGTVVTLYARPLRPLLYLSGAERPRWRLVARSLRNALWALRAPAAAERSWRARPLAPDEIASAAIPWPAPRYGTAVLERSAAMMSYCLQCPAAAMELYLLEDGAAPQGYMVLSFAPGQARLADCWLETDAPEAWQALVHLAVRAALRHEGVAEIAAMCSEPLLAAALEGCGFHVRAERPLYARAADGIALPSAGIRIQMLDDDAAYRHNGAKHFWA